MSAARQWRVHVDVPLSPGTSLTLPAAARHHLCTVLRVAVGEPVILFNGDGNDYAAVLSGSGKAATVNVLEVAINATESPFKIELVQAVSRGARMDTSIQKAVELGVAMIHPVITEKSGVRLEGERLQKKIQHWRGIIISACEQCGRSTLPGLSPPLPLTKWLNVLPDDGSNWIFAAGAQTSIGEAALPKTPCRLLIGPESGFSDAEGELCLASGFRAWSLGPRILRTETAGPAAIAILQARFGDLGHV